MELQIAAVPIKDFIERDGEGALQIVGSKCTSCGHLFVGRRTNCAACSARGHMEYLSLAKTGKIYAYTIVERSFPGVRTPFIDVTVDLDDGSHLKGTLEGVAPKPEAIPFDMPVKLVFKELAGADGGTLIAYAFEPAVAPSAKEI